MRRPRNKPTLEQIKRGNEICAWLILNDPANNQGLPLIWAQLWMERHGKPKAPTDEDYSLTDRVQAYATRKRQKAIQKRRERWKLRRWKVSHKQNLYTNVRGYSIIIFQQENIWSILIIHRLTDEREYSRRRYATYELAQDAAFDALIYMESKHRSADPRLLETMPK